MITEQTITIVHNEPAEKVTGKPYLWVEYMPEDPDEDEYGRLVVRVDGCVSDLYIRTDAYTEVYIDVNRAEKLVRLIQAAIEEHRKITGAQAPLDFMAAFDTPADDDTESDADQERRDKAWVF